ncbi:hypothetical protein [Corallococcus sp. M7]
MWKKASVVAAGVAALAMSSTAWAGWRYDYPVDIDTTLQIVTGSFGSARNSTDSLQYIDIGIQAGVFTYAYIWARDANGNQFYCGIFDPDLIALVGTVTADSFIRGDYDSTGNCTHIEVRNASTQAPKKL